MAEQMLAGGERAEVIRLLANDALEATRDSGAEAALLLIDTALSIALTRLGTAGAQEMSGLLIGHVMQQADAWTRDANRRQS